MNNYAQSPVIHDLDGYSFPQDYEQVPQLKRESDFDDGFGFDPSAGNENILPSTVGMLDNWSTTGPSDMFNFNQKAMLAKQIQMQKPSLAQLQQAGGMMPMSGLAQQMNAFNIPNSSATLSHYGTVTPPRSNSADSTNSKQEHKPAMETRRRGRGKSQLKTPLTPPDSNNNVTKTRKSGGRKRNNTAPSPQDTPEDDKRKASLEKNRVAAAKCRINKKEKTEQLQRDSHNKAKANAELRGLLQTMDSELQTLTGYLAAHASCPDCRDPEQLRHALQHIQEQQMANHYPCLSGGSISAQSPGMSIDGQSIYSQPGYFNSPAMTHPPLPEFDAGNDLDINSPMP